MQGRLKPPLLDHSLNRQETFGDFARVDLVLAVLNGLLDRLDLGAVKVRFGHGLLGHIGQLKLVMPTADLGRRGFTGSFSSKEGVALAAALSKASRREASVWTRRP